MSDNVRRIKPMTRLKSEVVDHIEQKFDQCEHPYAQENGYDWCNLCGAQQLNGVWVKPHWRDIIVNAMIEL